MSRGEHAGSKQTPNVLIRCFRTGVLKTSRGKELRGFLSIPGLLGLTVLALWLSPGFAAEPANSPSIVGVGIAPVATIAKRIAGDDVTVQTLITSGQDPHTFEPTPRQVQEFGEDQPLFFRSACPSKRC